MKPYYLPPLFFQKAIWIPTRLALMIFGSLRIKGLNNLKKIKGPVIFAVNHSNDIDPFMVPATLPFWSRFSPLFYVVREREFYNSKGWKQHLFNGWFINMWGGYSATVGLRDYEKSLASHIQILRDGHSFCVFPEGGITKDGNLRPAKGGISFLAHSTPCTIVPVAVSSVFEMSMMDFFLCRRKIVVTYGKPIMPQELYEKIEQPHTPGESVWKKEADYVMGKIGELIEK